MGLRTAVAQAIACTTIFRLSGGQPSCLGPGSVPQRKIPWREKTRVAPIFVLLRPDGLLRSRAMGSPKPPRLLVCATMGLAAT